MLKASATAACTVTKGGAVYTIPANVPEYEVFTLDMGVNVLDIAISGGEIVLSWQEEVL